MKILVASHPCSTPINQQIYAELQRLTGWRVSLLVPRVWKDEFGNRLHARLWEGCEARLLSVPVYLPGNIILHGYAHWLRGLLKAEKPDAIYIHHEPYAVATAQLVWASRTAGCVPIGFYSAQNLEKDYPPPFNWWERWVYRSSQFAFPVTEAVATVLRAKGYQGDFAVCPLPFDPELYRPYPVGQTPPALRHSPAETLFGYAGRLVEAKGLRTLVEALGSLPSEMAWRLALIGTGPFETELRALIQARGLEAKVRWLGYVPHQHMAAHLAALDVLILPSETQRNWKEQFGRVLVEAMACGTPVIGSDSGEIPRIIRDSGGGVCFPERDPHALARQLCTFITEPHTREHHARLGRAWALRHASLPKVAERMAQTIERACRSRYNLDRSQLNDALPILNAKPRTQTPSS